MRRTFEIEKEPDKVAEILSSLRKDQHLSRTFEGTAKNGSLNGYYTNLALINGMVIGYVKIKGQYDRTIGDLRIDVVPSSLYRIVLAFNSVATIILTYKGITEDKSFLIGSFLFLLMALGITVAFILESRSFIKRIVGINNLTNEINKGKHE